MAVIAPGEREKQRDKRKLLNDEKVEVLFEEEEHAGSWHDAIVIATDINCRELIYLHAIDKKTLISVSPAIEGTSDSNPKIYRNNIRPHQPRLPLKTSDIKYGLCVDAMIKNAWWEGVLVDDFEGSLKRWIFLPETGKLEVISVENLRPTKDWDEVFGVWKPRGDWKLFQAIRPFDRNGDLTVSAGQIWYDLNRSGIFKENIPFWHWGSVEDWHICVSELIQELSSVVTTTASKLSSLTTPPATNGPALPSPLTTLSLPPNSSPSTIANASDPIAPTSPACGASPTAATSSSRPSSTQARTSTFVTPSPPSIGTTPSHVRWAPHSSTPPPTLTVGKYSNSEKKIDWKPAVILAEPCKYHVSLRESYLAKGNCNGRGSQGEAAQILRRHLLYSGWTVEFSGNLNHPRFRYGPPGGGEHYYSLIEVCKLMKRQNEGGSESLQAQE